EKSVTRIGGKKSIPLNVRVIAATNVNLEEAIENHVFRSDLYYRLNVFSLHIPPLRERGNDIFLLTNHFLQKYQNPKSEPITKISEEVRTIFAAYTSPGNIRELENVIERCCILTSNGTLTKEALPSNIAACPENQNQIQSENDMKTTAASLHYLLVSGNLPLTDIPAENMSSVQDTFVSPTESVMNTDHITSAITAEEWRNY
ncbi:MAG: sigma 54-interacting transcriptional regulator, partial [Eubacterium ramulus]